MTIGIRLRNLRANFKYSQEYVAEQLGVSRQAVSKWEQDISKPDTDNIICLASLYGTTVDYILTGNFVQYMTENKKQKRTREEKRKFLMIVFGSLFSVLLISAALLIHLCPVDWEMGACRGGYIIGIYEIYSADLTQKFVDGMEADKEKILWAEPIKGKQDGTVKGRKLYLEFDVTYEHSEYGIKTERVRFVGTRYWINKFSWSGAIIKG